LWLRISIAPFETAIAVIIVVQALIATFGWGAIADPVAALLPPWQAAAFNIAYLAAGLTMLTGLFWPRGDVEGAGLVLLGSLTIARGIMYGTLLGWGVDSITSLAFSLAVGLACTARIRALMLSMRR
jgi:hypothetical protein